MSPHHRRINEEGLEALVLAAVDPLPQPLPDGTLFPAAEALGNGIPVPERLGQVAPRRAGARLVENGFEEHPVAEDRRTPGGVFEVTQHRFDFGPDGIRDEETSCHNRSQKKIIGGEPIDISRIRQHALVYCRNCPRSWKKKCAHACFIDPGTGKFGEKAGWSLSFEAGNGYGTKKEGVDGCR